MDAHVPESSRPQSPGTPTSPRSLAAAPSTPPAMLAKSQDTNYESPGVAGSVSPTSGEPAAAPSNAGGEVLIRRGAWSSVEDEMLVHLVETVRPLKWVYIAQEMKTRTSKQCRERYHNYLKPSLSRAPIRKEEGEKIEELVAVYGKKWAEISRHLPGRSDNAIKNWWNASVNRRRASQDVTPLALADNAKKSRNVQPQGSQGSGPQGGESERNISQPARGPLGQVPLVPLAPSKGIPDLIVVGQAGDQAAPRQLVPPQMVPSTIPSQLGPAQVVQSPAPQLTPNPPNGVLAHPVSPHSVSPQQMQPQQMQPQQIQSQQMQPQLMQPQQMQPQQIQPQQIQPQQIQPQQIQPQQIQPQQMQPQQMQPQMPQPPSTPVVPYVVPQPVSPATDTLPMHLRDPHPVQVNFSAMYAETSPRVGPSQKNSIHHASAPYPFTPQMRTDSRASSQARLSVSSLTSRSNSVVDEPPPIGPQSRPPAEPLFARFRQNLDIRRASTDSARSDSTSLLQYSLNNTGGNTRQNSVDMGVPAEMVAPPVPAPRHSRLSIANLMND